MALVTNPAYDQARQSMQQEPIYIIELAWNAGKPGTENLNDVYFSTTDVSKMGVVPAWLSSRLFPILQHDSISAITERIDEKNGTSSIGQLQFKLTDKDGFVTDIMKRAEADTQQSARRQKVELYIMYAGMDWVDRIKWRTMNIVDMQFDASKSEYRIQSSSILHWLKKDVFVPYTTTLQSAITSTAAPPFNITVADTTNYIAAIDHSSFGAANVGAIKINDEIFLWDTKTATSFHIVARSSFGSPQVTHAVGDDISEVAVLKGNPFELALRVLHSGSGDPAAAAYDVYPAHWGVGLYSIDVDEAEFVRVGSVVSGYDTTVTPSLETGNEYELVFSDSIQAKLLIERHLLRDSGAFGRVLGNGAYSCKDFEYTPQPGLDHATGEINSAGYTLLNQNNIVKWSAVKANMAKMSSILDLKYLPWPKDSGKPLRRLMFKNQAAFDRHGTEASIKITHRGLQQNNTAVAAAVVLANAMQARFTAPPVEMTVELLPSHHTLEVADIVAVDLPDVKDVFYTHRRWAANTDFVNGSRILTTGGLLYVVSNLASAGGTTGATEPVWGADLITDGTITWRKHDGHLARTFEVTSTSIDIKTGRPKLNLISQAEEPAWFKPGTSTGASRFADSAYQRGTDLSIIGWTGGVSPTGNVTLGSSGSITEYHYVGDITMSASTTLTILGEVRIFCTGTISDQIGFTLNGRGQGASGGVGTIPSTPWTAAGSLWYVSYNHTKGSNSGGFGAGGAGGGHNYYGVIMSPSKAGGAANGASVQVFGSSPVGGLFTKINVSGGGLYGAGGAAGGSISYPTPFGVGGNGGNGGAALQLIARAIDISNGSYDLRGADAPAVTASGGFSGQSGGGGGGGGTLVIAVENGSLGGGAGLFNPSAVLIAGGAAAASAGWYTGPNAKNGRAGRLFSRSF